MKIYKLRKYAEGLTFKEEEALLKKKGMRRLTPDKFFDHCEKNKYDDYLPCRLKTPGGLIRHGYYVPCGDYGRWFVVAIDRRADRLGVLAVKKENRKPRRTSANRPYGKERRKDRKGYKG